MKLKMPKRALEFETEWVVNGLPLEPKSKLRCSNEHPPIHVQQLHEKTLELLHRGANKNMSRNNNEIIATEPSKKPISNHYIESEKKPLRQMFIGNNLNLHINGEINSDLYSLKTCSICKSQKSEEGSGCNYCELLQCPSCALTCSVCVLPTCARCSINSFGGCEGVVCLSCCR